MNRLLTRALIVGAFAVALLPAVAMAAPPVSPIATANMQVALPIALHRFVPDAAAANGVAGELTNPNNNPNPNGNNNPAAADAGRASKAGNVTINNGQNNAVAAKPEKALARTDGYDISWPQCNGPDPAPNGNFNFAIIGVNGGKALTTNNCFKRQWDWASTGFVQAQVYINVNGRPANYIDWGCPAGDTNCWAYGYGRASAEQSLGYARSQGADPKTWWLDVETMNYWSPDQGSNASVIRGAIDVLQANGKDVGVYSTPYQWNLIAGQYAPRLPVWTAGADNREDAISRCTGFGKYAFGGGEVKLVQYIWANFDTNYAC